jgi:hypothetical protein
MQNAHVGLKRLFIGVDIVSHQGRARVDDKVFWSSLGARDDSFTFKVSLRKAI